MKFLIQLFFAFLIVAGGMFGAFMYYRIGDISLSFFEKEPPLISISEPLIGLGLAEKKINLDITDDQTGLDEVIVRVEQDGRSHELLKEKYEIHVHKKPIAVTINAKDLNLKEGQAELKVTAFDRSFQVNSAHLTVPFKIRYGKPRVSAITPQHNVALGGAELVFYKIKNASSSGVQVGTHFFPGYQAQLLDERFSKYPDIYFAFFALPYNFDKSTDKIYLTASDEVGNTSTSSFNYLVIPRKFKKVDIKLSDNFLGKVLPELLPGFFEKSKNPNSRKFDDTDNLPIELRLEGFKLINEDYRKLLGDILEETLKTTEEKRLSDWDWIRPMSAAPTSAFCESRSYVYEGQHVSSSLHAGVDLADVGNSPVRAANSGKIVLADEFGIYGDAIVIDHGFGFSSLYGHLSSINAEVGQYVEKNQVIGNSGLSGLAGGDHLHFEIRLHNLPIYPIEWWDKSWVNAHVIKKIDSILASVEADYS